MIPPADHLTPPAGWFPDPWNTSTVRWWNGRGWTPFTDSEPTPPGGGATAIRPGAGVAGLVLATLIVASGLGIRLVPPSTTAASILNWASVVVPVVGGPSLAWFASRRWGSGDPVADFGLTVRWADVGLGLFGALLLLLGEIVKDVVTVIVRDPLPVGLSLRHANFATAAVAIALVMFRPLAEELLLRGLILRGFESSAGRRAAVAIQLATAGVLGAAMTSGSVAAGAAGGIYAAAILTFLFRRTGRLGTGIIAGMLLAVLATLSLFPPV